MNDDSEVSDEQMVKCFGKYRNCTKNCRLKEVCLDKKREEERELRQRRYREANYIDEMDSTGNHSAVEYQVESKPEAEPSEKEIFEAIEYLDVSEKCRLELRKIYRLKLERERTDEAIRELVRKMGELYIHDPTGFEVLFFQILAGGNQKQLAEKRGCSKQNINKIIANGKKRLEAYRELIEDNPECRLSSREIAVYHAVEIEGLSYRKAAAMVGCSFRTIGNIAQKIRLKGIKMHKKHRGRKKATGKSNAESQAE